MAIWYLRDNTWHNAEHTVAQEIVNNATAANVPPATGDGTALSDAVKQNQVTLAAKFVAQTAGHFYGDSTLQIKNTGTTDVKIYMPVGTVFTVPNGGGQFQDLAAYALGPQGTQQAAPSTSTPAPTMTAAPTATAAAAAPTATQATSAAAATPTAMSAPASSTLPQTGSSDGTGASVGMVLALTALMLLALGLLTKLPLAQRKAPRR
ncbi:MAG: hypothetical protein ACJ78Q_10310 [Chloroflexia bacterium]